MEDFAEQCAQAAERLHILDAMVTAVEDRDEFMRLVGASSSADEARAAMQERYGFDETQAVAALDLQTRRFAALERDRIVAERVELIASFQAGPTPVDLRALKTTLPPPPVPGRG